MGGLCRPIFEPFKVSIKNEGQSKSTSKDRVIRVIKRGLKNREESPRECYDANTSGEDFI